eukprot:SAG22_NODE_2196_length_2852_cov_4.193244_3_plen_395_part_00
MALVLAAVGWTQFEKYATVPAAMASTAADLGATHPAAAAGYELCGWVTRAAVPLRYNGSKACTGPCAAVTQGPLIAEYGGGVSVCAIDPFRAGGSPDAPWVTEGICECSSSRSTGPISYFLCGAALVAVVFGLPDISIRWQRWRDGRSRRNDGGSSTGGTDLEGGDRLAGPQLAALAGPPAARSAGMDHMKFLLMVSVVMGHAGVPFLEISAQPAASMGEWLNMWVMPAFVFVAGCFFPPQPTPRHHMQTFGIGLTYVLSQWLLVVACMLVPQLPITSVACIEILIGRNGEPCLVLLLLLLLLQLLLLLLLLKSLSIFHLSRPPSLRTADLLGDCIAAANTPPALVARSRSAIRLQTAQSRSRAGWARCSRRRLHRPGNSGSSTAWSSGGSSHR